MAAQPPANLFLIVTGSTLRAEEVDRPLAYYLKQRIDQVLEADDGLGPFEIRVVADFRWIHDDSLQNLPTISVGGPGVNALAHRWLDEVPAALVVDEQYFIQLDAEGEEPRASIWGMDNTSTQIAVSVFVDRFLSPFLEQCTAGASYPTDLDEVD